ncbi:Beta-galactosidase (Beta-gal) (Lactase) [Durusdinium trenchii]|uniref:beta-galactosidase n=1 Tax=Durusdinium trenchii TaxID=1381693 RepID=A0ABP0IAD0_9DINO
MVNILRRLVWLPWPAHAPLRYYPSAKAAKRQGLYRTVFHVPPEHADRRVHLVFHAVGSAVMLWVDGQYIGYSQDSMTAAEFDITDALKQGKQPESGGHGASVSEALLSDQHLSDHVLVAMVPMWCDGSYLEDQDQWWLTGIHRTVELHFAARHEGRAHDYSTETWLEGNEGQLKILCRLSGPAAKASMRFSLSAAGSSDALTSCSAVPEKSRSYTESSEEECWCALPSQRLWKARSQLIPSRRAKPPSRRAQAWREQFLHRTWNMFQRAENHPCVIVWSLGNESGWGPNFAACAQALRQWDPQRRPVQYEGAEGHGDAVFFCGDGQGQPPGKEDPSRALVRYWSPPMILPLAAPDTQYPRPDAQLRRGKDEHRQIQGGFVWEWADGAIKAGASQTFDQ